MKKYIKSRMIDRGIYIAGLLYIVLILFIITQCNSTRINSFYAIYNGLWFGNIELLKLTLRCLLMGSVLFTFGYKLQEVFGDNSIYIQIRGRNRLESYWYIYKYAIYYASIVIGITFMICLGHSMMFDGSCLRDIGNVIKIVIPLLVLHFEEILFFEGLIVIAMLYEVNAAFVIYGYVLMMVICMFPKMKWMEFIPAGIASISRISCQVEEEITTEGLSAIVALIEMSILNLLVFVIGIIKRKRG